MREKMKVSKYAIGYIKQELVSHNWNSFKIRRHFGRVFIDFKNIHDAEGIIQWENAIHDSRNTLGFFLNRISSLRIEIVPFYSEDYWIYSKTIDDSCILLSQQEIETVSLFAANLIGFKKIKQTNEGSVFIFNSRDNLFGAIGILHSFISDLRKIPSNKICIFSGKKEVVFHTRVKDNRSVYYGPIEELQSS